VLFPLAGGTGALWACAIGPPRPSHEFSRLWREYRELPDVRALAIAGELRRDQWVAGVAAGHASREQAEAGALEECRKRRLERRMRAPCLVYAVGDEVVRPGS